MASGHGIDGEMRGESRLTLSLPAAMSCASTFDVAPRRAACSVAARMGLEVILTVCVNGTPRSRAGLVRLVEVKGLQG